MYPFYEEIPSSLESVTMPTFTPWLCPLCVLLSEHHPEWLCKLSLCWLAVLANPFFSYLLNFFWSSWSWLERWAPCKNIPNCFFLQKSLSVCVCTRMHTHTHTHTHTSIHSEFHCPAIRQHHITSSDVESDLHSSVRVVYCATTCRTELTWGLRFLCVFHYSIYSCCLAQYPEHPVFWKDRLSEPPVNISWFPMAHGTRFSISIFFPDA